MKLFVTISALYVLFLSAVVVGGCKHKTVIDQQLNEAEPVLAFTYTGKQVAPAEMEFRNLSMYADTYQWNFGNGKVSTSQHPGKIRFDQPGEYEVILSGQNKYKKVLVSKMILILANDEPTARFSFEYKNNQTFAPATIRLNNQSANADSFEWEIKGEILHSIEPADVIFGQPGVYPIRLTAIKGGTRSTIFEQVINVTANPNPIALFTRGYEPFPYHVGQQFVFVNKSKNSDSWMWTFESGKPATSAEEHPVVEFTTPGDHKITLIARKGSLSSQPAVTTIRIAH